MIELHDVDDRGNDESTDLLPHPGQLAVSVAKGFLLLVAALVAVGLTITYLDPLEPIREWDLSTNERLSTDRADTAVSAARTVSRLGDTLGVLGVAVLISIGLAGARRWRVLLLVPIALLIEVTTFLAVNYLVQRPRPDVATVGSVPSTFSFPSGHVAATLVCWVGLAVALKWLGARWAWVIVGAFGVVAVASMAWARVYVGMHHPSDVTAGVLMGVASVAIAKRSLDEADPVPSHVDQPKPREVK